MDTRGVRLWGAVAFGVVTLLAVAIVLPSLLPPTEYIRAVGGTSTSSSDHIAQNVVQTPDMREKISHVPLPSAVKSVYITSCVAGTPKFRNEVVGLVDRTEINALVIDVKDYSGTISFKPQNPELLPAWTAAKCGAQDMKEFIASVHKKGIYVIGRITVFQDPFRSATRPDLAVKRASDGGVWKDHKGLSFIDVSAKDHWEYIAALATDAYDIGFDELNFDYVRFPSDGNMKDVAFTHTGTKTKPEALELFFADGPPDDAEGD